MAMKLNTVQKNADNYIRQLNAQIEKAFKVSDKSEVSQNLIAHAQQMFGELKTSKAGIPQIARTKKALNTYIEQNAIAKSKRTTHTTKGNYKRPFDVTYHHQKAISQVLQSRHAKGKKQPVTLKDIAKQIEFNTNIAGIFELYEVTMSGGGIYDDEYDELLKIMDNAKDIDITDFETSEDILKRAEELREQIESRRRGDTSAYDGIPIEPW